MQKAYSYFLLNPWTGTESLKLAGSFKFLLKKHDYRSESKYLPLKPLEASLPRRN